MGANPRDDDLLSLINLASCSSGVMDAQALTPIYKVQETPYTRVDVMNVPPLSAIRKQKIRRHLTWTISFTANNHGLTHATGLVVNQ